MKELMITRHCLFPFSAPHKRLQIGGVERRLLGIGQKLDIPFQKVHPHKFRRMLATMAIDKGMPIEQLQQRLGHKRIDDAQHAMVTDNVNWRTGST